MSGPFEFGRSGDGGGAGVDSVFGRTGDVIAEDGDYTASQVTNVPAGNIAATNVQAAIDELDTEKAPAFTVDTTLTYVANVLKRAAITGDVAVSAGSNTSAIGNNKVTNAMLAQAAATTLKGNPTGGTANEQDVTLNATLSFSGTTLQRAALTGDVTVPAGSNTTTITSLALSKLANAAAQYDIVGRKTASGGAWEDCTRAQLELAVTNSSGNTFLGDAFYSAGVGVVTGASARQTIVSVSPITQILGLTGANATQLMARYSNDGSPAATFFAKSRGTTIGAHGAVASSDFLGVYRFFGDDGTSMVEGARISSIVTGAVSTGVVPARLEFGTASAAGSFATRWTIEQDGGLYASGLASLGAGTVYASGAVRTGQYTIGTLPSAATAGAGAQAFVTNGVAVPVFNAIPSTTGSQGVDVVSDGTNWRYG